MQKIYALKHIETPRLIIRPVQLGDEISLNKAVNNSLESLQRWMPWADDPSLETTRDFIQKGVFARASETVADFPMVVIHKGDQKIISGSGYSDRSNPDVGLYEIGYWCDVDYQGNGYVTEYVNALAQYAFKKLNAKTIVIRMDVDNLKSIAIAERLNFENQGTRPSVTVDNATDYYFTCRALKNLPPLKVSWTHEEHESIDSKMIAWAKETLSITDDKSFANSRAIVKTPWSNVLKINTGNGFVYLKHTPELIALEARIIQILRDQFHVSVPTVIAHNPELNCFLMKDAGRRLREILKQKFDEALLCRAIDQFTSLQLTVSDRVDVFLDIGVPDWRLNKLPNLYKDVISQKNLLMADGLSEMEISELEALLPQVSNLCKKLSDYSIKQTIVQPDFNDNNTLIDDVSQSITIIDLGEISISHPFFSILNCLQQIRKHYGLTENDDTYLRIKDACLKNYMDFESKKNLLDALEIAHVLWFVYELLAHDRLMQACGKEKLMLFQHGKLSGTLKEFIAICK